MTKLREELQRLSRRIWQFLHSSTGDNKPREKLQNNTLRHCITLPANCNYGDLQDEMIHDHLVVGIRNNPATDGCRSNTGKGQESHPTKRIHSWATVSFEQRHNHQSYRRRKERKFLRPKPAYCEAVQIPTTPQPTTAKHKTLHEVWKISAQQREMPRTGIAMPQVQSQRT